MADMNMPQAGLSDKKLLLGVENRNHVWRDLSRLVDVGCKNGLIFTPKHFSGKELLNILKLDSVTRMVWRTGTMCGGTSPG